jgi:muramidase (phage lysozyme)
MPNTKNRKAFLDMIAFSEGTVKPKHKTTKNDGYDVIVTGNGVEEIFTDYTEHPFVHRKPKQVKGDLYSTASGRYQFMRKDWEHYRDALGLPDFSPESQDKWALQLIRERGALPLIDQGNFDLAVKRVSNLWASLPGAGYNQPEHSIDKLRTAYLAAGGELA